MNNGKTVQVVRNMNDANVLLSKGYKMMFMTLDRESRLLRFHFENSEALQKILQDLALKRKNQN